MEGIPFGRDWRWFEWRSLSAPKAAGHFIFFLSRMRSSFESLKMTIAAVNAKRNRTPFAVTIYHAADRGTKHPEEQGQIGMFWCSDGTNL